MKFSTFRELISHLYSRESQTAIRKKSNVSQGTISKIIDESTSPSLDTVISVASAYGLSINDLLAMTDIQHLYPKLRLFARIDNDRVAGTLAGELDKLDNEQKIITLKIIQLLCSVIDDQQRSIVLQSVQAMVSGMQGQN